MATTIPSAALVPLAPVFTSTERIVLAGFRAGYSGLTRQAYELGLRQYASWCQQHQLYLFTARRAGIEFFARDLEARGRARATITRRLCTIAGFCRYAAGEELPDHSPAAHVRRPRLGYQSHATGLDRNEPGALLAAAGPGPPTEHALIWLLALNGLRVSQTTGAGIQALGIERGHRTLVITGKGGEGGHCPTRAAPPGRSAWPSGDAPRGRSSWPLMAGGWTATAPGGSSGASSGWPQNRASFASALASGLQLPRCVPWWLTASECRYHAGPGRWLPPAAG